MFGSRMPEVTVSASKLDNGYIVVVQRVPRKKGAPPAADEVVAISAEERDPEQALDDVIDGVGAFMRKIHDQGAGEDWKADEDREKIRKGFRAVMPGIARQVDMAAYEPPPQPTVEQYVFESKEKLIQFLSENL